MNERIKLLITLLFIGIFTFGCMARQIAYIPYPASINDPKTVIYKILEEQPGVHTPQEIEIKDDKFRVSATFPSARLFVSASTRTFVVYYDNIGLIELYKFRNYYKILIKNEAGGIIYMVVTYDLDKAKSFIDALHSMTN